MPCTNDYPTPNHSQVLNQETAKLILWVLTRLPKLHESGGNPAFKTRAKTYTKMIKESGEDVIRVAAKDEFCSLDLAPDLCSTLRVMERDDLSMFNQLVYNSRDRRSRDLADWWEDHQQKDRAREKLEKAISKEEKECLGALEKLSKSELASLRLSYDRDVAGKCALLYYIEETLAAKSRKGK